MGYYRTTSYFFLFILALTSPLAAEAQCITRDECFVQCCPSGTPTCSQTCRNTCGNYPVSCDNPNGVEYLVWRPTEGYWYELSAAGATTTTYWGLNGDAPLRGTYSRAISGLAGLDLLKSLWRPSSGNWYSCYFTDADGCNNPSNYPVQWGLPGDYPVLGDIDGDGYDDLIVWRPSFGLWYYIESSTGDYHAVQWGLPGDYPLVSDLDGDDIGDLVVWRNSTGEWYALLSSTEYSKENGDPLVKQWGLPGDHPLRGDHDGDSKDDLVVWRPQSGNWYVCGSVNDFDCTRGTVEQFGLPGDKPIQRDFDSDGMAELAVWRPSNGIWYHRNSSTGQMQTQQWGLQGDVPNQIGIVDLVDYLYPR